MGEIGIDVGDHGGYGMRLVVSAGAGSELGLVGGGDAVMLTSLGALCSRLQEAGTTVPELGGRRGVRPSQRAGGRTAPELVYACRCSPRTAYGRHDRTGAARWCLGNVSHTAGPSLGEQDKWADKGGELG